MEYGVIGIVDGAGLGGGMQDRGFKAWPGLGLVTALALVLERWYGVVSWWWSTAEKKKKRKKTGNAVVRHTLPMFQVSLKGCT